MNSKMQEAGFSDLKPCSIQRTNATRPATRKIYPILSGMAFCFFLTDDSVELLLSVSGFRCRKAVSNTVASPLISGFQS